MSQHNIFWLTGLPCSGKTTIANELSRHIYAEVIDGDSIRELTNNKDFSSEARALNIRYVGAIAHRLSYYVDVIVSLVSPLRGEREEIKKMYPNVHEIYIKCPLDVCIERDRKGMYAKAIKGEIDKFTGISQEYEEPINPAMVIETNKCSIDECVRQILALHKIEPKALIIGRWQPLHGGHKWLVEQVRNKGHKVILGIRNTRLGKNNPYSVQERIQMIQTMFGTSVDCLVLPDIAGVYYGRNVGYEIKEIVPPETISQISASKLRRHLK